MDHCHRTSSYSFRIQKFRSGDAHERKCMKTLGEECLNNFIQLKSN